MQLNNENQSFGVERPLRVYPTLVQKLIMVTVIAAIPSTNLQGLHTRDHGGNARELRFEVWQSYHNFSSSFLLLSCHSFFSSFHRTIGLISSYLPIKGDTDREIARREWGQTMITLSMSAVEKIQLATEFCINCS